MKVKLALFDFDGTLTRRDTMFAFIEFARGANALAWSLVALSPLLGLHYIGLVSAERAKKRLLSWHFKGVRKEQMDIWARDFSQHRLVGMFNDLALEKLHFHRSKGHEVYVVTASLDMWVMPWMEQQGLKCICTRAKWVDGAYSGEFETPNCSGKEKVRRLEAELKKDDYLRVYAYGDSRGDKEMLDWAHTGFYRCFT